MKTRLAWLVSFAVVATLPAVAQSNLSVRNQHLAVTYSAQDRAYEIVVHGLARPVLVSGIGAEVNGDWIRSSSYPHADATEASFEDALGPGHALKLTFSGLPDKPDLVCDVRLYDRAPYGDVSVAVLNRSGHEISVQAIRVVDALGKPPIDLGASEQNDRVLAEPPDEDPAVHISGLSGAPHGVYVGTGNTLIYNLASKQSLMFAALTSDRFATISHLKTAAEGAGVAHIASFTVDSTGTTETAVERDRFQAGQTVWLSLPVAPGAALSSERVMFAASSDYLRDLENYGQAVRLLHHPDLSKAAPMGWWSWTAFYGAVNEGEVATNADWLARHLLPLGYDFCHIDEGYAYARGEFITPNATQFPHGMSGLEHQIASLGLVPAIWTAPFEVSIRSWVFEHHPDWLVHDAAGKPIRVGHVAHEELYALDSTNPGAQDYLRKTYATLTRDWGIRYIKMDFMADSAIEGFYYRPHTTALEAQQIGLKIIRETVGKDVLLDKDGSPLLNPVGLVDEGRIAPDTGHSFEDSKYAAPNIAARFYMNGNFFVADPDAFSVTTPPDRDPDAPRRRRTGLTLGEAQVQIVLAALCGGMYEIGDDLPTLGSQPDRLALVENQELIAMNRLGRAALPLDLMTFRPEDEQPSVFFLVEDPRQAMLAVFNWTEKPLSHSFTLAQLGLPADHPFHAFDVLNKDAELALNGGALELSDQQPHSVRLIKLVDDSVPAAAPQVASDPPASAATGQAVTFAATLDSHSVPAISYHWDFGDGTAADGPNVTHTYTHAGTYSIDLAVQGVEGLPAHKTMSITVTGEAKTRFDLPNNRRYTGPSTP